MIEQKYIEYFDLISSYFDPITHYLGDTKTSHIDLGNFLSNYPLIADLILDSIEDLATDIESFWVNNASDLFSHIKGDNTLKCLYSGDITPVALEDFVKKTALYVDTIIIPDPVYNLILAKEEFDEKFYLNKLIRHVFNVWRLKDLILADSETKILFILPIRITGLKFQDAKPLFLNASRTFLNYTERLFDATFGDEKEALEYLKLFENTKTLFRSIQNKNILPNLFQDKKELESFLANIIEMFNQASLTKLSLGSCFGNYLRSQFLRVQEHEFFCSELSAEPIYDYELPWFFFNYEMSGLDMDASIMNALHKEKFNWINSLPLSVIKVFREENKLGYMRNVLRNGITSLKVRCDTNLEKTANQVQQNFQEAFQRQQSEIESLEKQARKIVEVDIPITSGGFLAGFIPFYGQFVSVAMVGRDLKNLEKTHNTLENEISDKKTNGINLLIKAFKNE